MSDTPKNMERIISASLSVGAALDVLGDYRPLPDDAGAAEDAAALRRLAVKVDRLQVEVERILTSRSAKAP